MAVILRGPDSQRNRFWAERAGAAAYVVKGRMGDLVRTLSRAISSAPPSDGFCTQLSGDTADLRDRIASHLDAALFESAIASEVRALGTCGAFRPFVRSFLNWYPRSRPTVGWRSRPKCPRDLGCTPTLLTVRKQTTKLAPRWGFRMTPK